MSGAAWQRRLFCFFFLNKTSLLITKIVMFEHSQRQKFLKLIDLKFVKQISNRFLEQKIHFFYLFLFLLFLTTTTVAAVE